MRIGTLACVISGITSVVAIPADAHAQPPSDASAPARARVLVKIAGGAADVDATTTVLRERIADADASGTIESATKIDRSEVLAPIVTPTGELARVWLDLTSDPLVVYIVDGAGTRVLVREVPHGTNPEVAREAR